MRRGAGRSAAAWTGAAGAAGGAVRTAGACDCGAEGAVTAGSGFAAGAGVTSAAGVATRTGGATTIGRAGGAAAAAARGGAAAASCRSLIARKTSPGFETLDRSILGRASGSARRGAPLPPLLPRLRDTRTRSASSNSRELECVFFSVTPTASSTSRIALLFTSSSRAKSLIRTLLIRPF
jgi:hypothetical protein